MEKKTLIVNEYFNYNYIQQYVEPNLICMECFKEYQPFNSSLIEIYDINTKQEISNTFCEECLKTFECYSICNQCKFEFNDCKPYEKLYIDTKKNLIKCKNCI